MRLMFWNRINITFSWQQNVCSNLAMIATVIAPHYNNTSILITITTFTQNVAKDRIKLCVKSLKEWRLKSTASIETSVTMPAEVNAYLHAGWSTSFYCKLDKIWTMGKPRNKVIIIGILQVISKTRGGPGNEVRYTGNESRYTRNMCHRSYLFTLTSCWPCSLWSEVIGNLSFGLRSYRPHVLLLSTRKHTLTWCFL